MSWISKAAKKLTKHTSKGFIGTAFGSSDPTAKAIGGFLDPGGLAISNMQTGDKPRTMRSALDPGGYFDPAAPAGPAPNSYQSPHAGQRMKLSPAAQQLYDQMKARSAQRQQGVAPAAATGMPVGVNPKANTGMPVQRVGGKGPQVGMAPPQTLQAPMRMPGAVMTPGMPSQPMAYADGGSVRAGFDEGHVTFESKVFKRKPNGKPC